MTSPQYPYVEISGEHFAIHQNVVKLAYYLFFKSNSVQPYLEFTPKLLFKNMKRLLLIQLGFIKGVEVIHLPIFGNLCLSIHQGYKIFQFRKGSVVKLFESNIPNEVVASEIRSSREAGDFDFAPTVFNYSIEDRWLEEELINGTMGYPITNFNPKYIIPFFNQNILPILEQLIYFKEPVCKSVSEVGYNCLETIRQRLILSEPELDAVKINSIQTGIRNLVYILKGFPENNVYLSFSHGDFSFVNIVTLKNKIKVIDWEGVATRSVLFDFYNWFFTELYYKRVTSNLDNEICIALNILENNLRNLLPDISVSISTMASTYRLLFYLERIEMLLQRKLTNKLLDVVLLSYKTFQKHEAFRPAGLNL